MKFVTVLSVIVGSLLLAVPTSADPLVIEDFEVGIDLPHPHRNATCIAPCTGTATAPATYNFEGEKRPFEPNPIGFWKSSVTTADKERINEQHGPASQSLRFTANTLGLWSFTVDGAPGDDGDSGQSPNVLVVSAKDRPAPIKVYDKKKKIKLGYVLKIKSPKDSFKVVYTDRGIPAIVKKSKCPKPRVAGVRCFKLQRTQFGPTRRVKFEIKAWNKGSVGVKLGDIDRVADTRVVKYTIGCKRSPEGCRPNGT